MDGIQARRIRLERRSAHVLDCGQPSITSCWRSWRTLQKPQASTLASRGSCPHLLLESGASVTVGELHAEFARLESEPVQPDLEGAMLDREAEDDDAFGEPPVVVLGRAARFEMIKQLLLANQLGIS